MKTRTKLFRIFGILLGALFVLACLVGFAACGDSDDDGDVNKGDPTVEEGGGSGGSGDSGNQGGGEGGNQDQHTHSYTSTVTKEATCGDDGVITYTCSCGDTYTETIPATGAHEVDKAGWTVMPASCGEAGSRTNTCLICGHTVTETIPATSEHVVADEGWTVTTEATCGADGEQTGTCTICGATVTEVIPATGEHTYGALTATETSGVYTQTCSVCGDVQTVDVSEEDDDGNAVVLRAEAENAVIDVDESMMNYWLMNEVFQGNYISTMGFLFDIQDDTTASGGQSVGYLAHGNPTLTFTIDSSVAVSNAKITVHGASCDINDDAVSSVFGLMTAGVSEYKGEDHNILTHSYTTTSEGLFGPVTTTNTSPVTLSGSYSGSTSVFVGEGDALAYNSWGDLTGTVDLVEGENTFVLTHDGSGVNFDYIEIEAPETTSGEVELSFVETDNSDLVTYDPNWTAYDVVTLEAENAGCINADDSTAFMETVDFVQTGEEKVINFTKGDTMVFQLVASDEIEDAYVTVNATSSGTLAASDITITSTGSFVVPDPEDPSKDTTEVSTTTLSPSLRAGAIVASVDLGAGINYIELTCASDATLEVDNIVVDWDYVDADADYGSDHTTAKSAGRGSYIVTTIDEAVTGGLGWSTANATATDDGYSLRMEAEEAGLYNAVGKTDSLISGLLKTETWDSQTGIDENKDALTIDGNCASVGNFNTSGDQIVFAIYSEEETTGVTMTITGGSAVISSLSLGNFVGSEHYVLVNDTETAMEGTIYGNGGIATGYASSWGYLTVSNITLQAGMNYIVFDYAGAASLNLDCITLTWGATA